MKKQLLLKSIAETAYNIGYGAKVNFATYDIVEKAPGFLGFVALVVGIYALFIKELTSEHVGAAMVVLGVITLYVNNYQAQKDKYDELGKEQTIRFGELKRLFRAAQALSDNADFSAIELAHQKIEQEGIKLTQSKQILFSDWYAHYKFFWQQQTDWIEEARPFTLFRDKLPLTFTVAMLTVLMAVLGAGVVSLVRCYAPCCS
jgi:hypothetical protein